MLEPIVNPPLPSARLDAFPARNRRATSNVAANCDDFAVPIPLQFIIAVAVARLNASKPSNSVSRSKARSFTFTRVVPDPSSMASNSESVNACGPSSAIFSRGISSFGKSLSFSPRLSTGASASTYSRAATGVAATRPSICGAFAPSISARSKAPRLADSDRRASISETYSFMKPGSVITDQSFQHNARISKPRCHTPVKPCFKQDARAVPRGRPRLRQSDGAEKVCCELLKRQAD